MSERDATVRMATAADAESMVAIYNYYVEETVVTFEEQRVSASDMAQRMADVLSASLPWLVAERAGRVLGYAYASKWRARSAYRFSSEITVYVEREQIGRGLGSQLYDALFPRLAECGLHAIMGGIALPNPASIALHEKFGLKKVAHFSEVGLKFGRWIDVGYWQRTL